MKKEMNAFDVRAMVKEMQCLLGGYVDKVFHWDRRSVLIRINAPEGRRELLFKDGKWLHMPKDRPETPDTPSNFAVHLRKMMGNARVQEVRQQGFDRIVTMKLSTKEASYQIVFEMFGDGNLIVVEDGKIVNCLEQKTWKHRDVRIGADYQFPPSRLDPENLTLEDFTAALAGSTSDTVRSLATAVNMGGQYAEEACLRSSVEKNRKASALTDEERLRLHGSLRALFAELTEKPAPTVYYQGDFAIDASPILLLQREGAEKETFESFSAALDEFIDAKAPEEEDVRDDELERLQRQLEQQEESIERLSAEAEVLMERANLLYQHYANVTKLLGALKAKAEELNWDQFREFVSPLPFFVSLDPQHELIVVRIDAKDVPLNYTVSLEENSDLLFKQAKELKDKVRGAEMAVQETEKRIEDRKKVGEQKRLEAKAKIKPTKQFWFESYRWFITAQGRMVLGGRDARSNEQVVKKHLDLADRYSHADVHGAASVIIKGGEAADENELREVCAFALANSKAWGAGAAEGSAYWVLPDQVSKTPAAGEFVPRGGFIIRGKRNYCHHLMLQLGIGEIEYQGSRKVMAAPVDTIKAMSKRYIIIEPGETEKGKFSSQISKMFEVPEEEIARILPPGKSRLVQQVGMEEKKEG
jgi:predicted ribosome quality control (RQC) complex YloA/Tae2 family protein